MEGCHRSIQELTVPGQVLDGKITDQRGGADRPSRLYVLGNLKRSICGCVYVARCIRRLNLDRPGEGLTRFACASHYVSTQYDTPIKLSQRSTNPNGKSLSTQQEDLLGLNQQRSLMKIVDRRQPLCKLCASLGAREWDRAQRVTQPVIEGTKGR